MVLRAAPVGSSREQQIRHVGARDQQDESDSGHQHDESSFRVVSVALLQPFGEEAAYSQHVVRVLAYVLAG
jgi:hypothetical protein